MYLVAVVGVQLKLLPERADRASATAPARLGRALQSCSFRALLARPAAVSESGISRWKYIGCSNSEMKDEKHSVYSTQSEKHCKQLLCVT